MLKGATVLITGGTGSWGQELTDQLLRTHAVGTIRIFSRGEHQQVTMRQRFDNNPKIEFYIGDVRDATRLEEVMKKVDIVFHLAALKHVPVVENNPWESVLTNIYGTQNVINGARKNEVKKMILVSTDKAVDPLNLYGVTKACAERLVINANSELSPTRFVCFRAGNVIGTNGSVIPLFYDQLKTTNTITVTDNRMTRFFVKKSEAVKQLIHYAVGSVGGETFVLDMKALNIKDLAEVMIKQIGKSGAKITYIGLRPGEKLLEHLISRSEVERTYQLGKCYVILPFFPPEELRKKYEKFRKVDFIECESKHWPKISKKEIYELLKSEGWLKDKKEDSTPSNPLEVFEKQGWTNFKASSHGSKKKDSHRRA